MKVAKLVTELTFKVDKAPLKEYDKLIKQFRDKIKKLQGESIGNNNKETSKAKKNLDSLLEYELKIRAKIAQIKDKQAQKDQKVREKVLAEEQKTRRAIDLANERSRNKAKSSDERTADLKKKMELRLASLKRKQEEKRIKQELKNIRDAQIAREKALREEQKIRRAIELAAERARNKAQRDADKKKNDIDRGKAFINGGLATGTKSLFDSSFNFLKDSVGKSADIQQESNRVRGFGGLSPKDAKEIKKMAMDMSKDSSRNTAVQILEGMTELAKAGYKGKSLKTLTSPILDFATGADVSFEQAATLSTDMLTTFKMKLTDITKVTDILTAGLNESKLGFQDLSYGLKYMAPTAAMAGMNLEKTVTTLALLSQAGLKGSTPGTSSRKIITDIATSLNFLQEEDPKFKTKKGKKRQKASLSQLGINEKDVFTKDANGKESLDLINTLRLLAKKTKGMSKAKQISTLTDIFGKTAQNAAAILGNIDAKELDRLVNAIEKSKGATKKVKGILEQGVNPQINKTLNSFTVLQDKISEGLLPIIEKFLKKIQDLFNWLSNLPDWITNIGTILLVAIPAVLAYLTAWFGIQALISVLATLGVAITTTTVLGALMPLAWLAGIALVGFVLWDLWNVFTTGKGVIADLFNSVMKWFGFDIPAMFDAMLPKIEYWAEKFKNIFSNIWGFIKNGFSDAASAMAMNYTINGNVKPPSLAYSGMGSSGGGGGTYTGNAVVNVYPKENQKLTTTEIKQAVQQGQQGAFKSIARSKGKNY